MEATWKLYLSRDWLVSQIKARVLRPGIDFVDRTTTASSSKRYLVNLISAMRWLNGAQAVAVKIKSKAFPIFWAEFLGIFSSNYTSRPLVRTCVRIGCAVRSVVRDTL